VLERTAIVENAPILGLLYLYNNLHAVHHERPVMPWYDIPRWYRANRDRLVRENGGMVYDGYRDVARRFLLREHDAVAHPFGVTASPGEAAARRTEGGVSAASAELAQHVVERLRDLVRLDHGELDQLVEALAEQPDIVDAVQHQIARAQEERHPASAQRR
jgi:hypothetical protein